MGNFQIKVDLLKLQGAAMQDMRATDGSVKRCVVIPIWEARLYEGKKGTYLDLRAVELRTPQYEDTHLVKQSVTAERYNAMNEEERTNIPIVGNMRPTRGTAQGQTQRTGSELPPLGGYREPEDLPL